MLRGFHRDPTCLVHCGDYRDIRLEAIEYQRSNPEALMDTTKSKDSSITYKKFGADKRMHSDDALAVSTGKL